MNPGDRIAAAAVAIAGGYRKGAGKRPGGKGCLSKRPTSASYADYRFAHALAKVPRWACCDCAVTTAVRWSGMDDSFPGASWPSATICAGYLEKSSKWDYKGLFRVGRRADGSRDGAQRIKLQPGDILVRKENRDYAVKHPNSHYPNLSRSHIRIYVGRSFANRRFHRCNCTYMEADHDAAWPHLSKHHAADGDLYAVYRRNTKGIGTSKYAKEPRRFEKYLPDGDGAYKALRIVGVRSRRSKSSKLLGRLKKGSRVTLKEVSENSSGTWGRVASGKFEGGYVLVRRKDGTPRMGRL